jgi:hypothetical protein
MRVKLILPILVLLGATSTQSLAQQYDRGSLDEQQACTPDVFRLCSAYIPNVTSIVNCLKAEKRNLSPECRLVMDRRANMRRVKEAN